MKKDLLSIMQNGVTLMELTLFMGLMAIFLVITTQIFLSALSVQTESESVSAVEQDGRFFLARFQYDIGRATTIAMPAAEGDTSSSLSFVADGKTYTYLLSGDNMQLTDDTGVYTLNSFATNVSNLQFVRRGNVNGKPTITTSFTLTSRIRSEQGYQSKNFQTTYGAR